MTRPRPRWGMFILSLVTIFYSALFHAIAVESATQRFVASALLGSLFSIVGHIDRRGQ